MPLRLLRDPACGRIAVFRALQLGDILCITPALRALRQAYPRAAIDLIGLPWSRSLTTRCAHRIDGFIEFPGHPGFPEQRPRLAALPGFFAEVRARRYDLVLQMHGSGLLSNPLVALFGAKAHAGHFAPGHHCPDARTHLEWHEDENEVTRYLRLLEFLGIPAQGAELEFPVLQSDLAPIEADAALAAAVKRPYVCIHPGASRAEKCWPAERFAAVATELAGAGYQIILTGAAKETALTRRISAHLDGGAVDSAPLDLPLGSLAALIEGASLLVSNDTGVSHLAAATRTPSVVVFTAADPARWAPLDRERHRALKHPHGVAVTDVIAEARDVLRLSRPRRAARTAKRACRHAAGSPRRRIDVLIPTYRRAGALAVCLTSLCAQSRRDFRVVISDQTDASPAFADPVVQTPLRWLGAHGVPVELHHHLPRRGIAEQRAFLLGRAAAPYCLFLDDDVLLETDLLGRMVTAIEEEQCGFVGSAVIGLSYVDDVRPHEQAIELWQERVHPEIVRPGTCAWQRHRLHSAANLWHVQNALGFTPDRQAKYRVAWVGACVLYDTGKLRACNGFDFWKELPVDHCGEDAMAQLNVMARYGGCALIPSGAYHQELPTTIASRECDAPMRLLGTAPSHKAEDDYADTTGAGALGDGPAANG